MFYVIVLLLSFFFFFFICPTWAAVRAKTCSTFLGLCPLFDETVIFFFFLSNSLLERSMIPVKTSLLFIIQHMDVGLRPVGCVHWGQGSQWKALPVSVCVWKVFLSAWKSVLNHEPVRMATERATPNSTQVVSCHQLWTNVITSFPGFFFLPISIYLLKKTLLFL